MSKDLKLKYGTPAGRTNEGWEKYSLPIGNGYGGASVFGGTDEERLQFTTNVFANTFSQGGVSNFLELYIEFNDVAENYERGLDIKTGIAFSSYKSAFGLTNREAFFSYPDNVFAYRETERPQSKGGDTLSRRKERGRRRKNGRNFRKRRLYRNKGYASVEKFIVRRESRSYNRRRKDDRKWRNCREKRSVRRYIARFRYVV